MSHHDVERIKLESRGLRGTLAKSLREEISAGLPPADERLVKFHGSYLQDDRDLRDERRRQKLEPAYGFMIRTRTPGGVIEPTQWLQLDDVATRFATRGLRITTRQTIQFHGVVKRELKATMQAINAAMIDTIAACGDVNRNVMIAANPAQSRIHGSVHATAAALSEHLLPRTRAYYEIWLDEQRVAGTPDVEDEPHYGAAYLPRKFKIGFAVPPVNDIDVFAQDLGFIAIVERGVLVGYDVTGGGGMGATHGDAKTYPRLGDRLGFIEPGDVIAVATAAMAVQRDWGDRTERKHARLKYTIDDRGINAFRAEVEGRAGLRFRTPRKVEFEHNGDRFGWVDGHDGRLHLTLRIPSGRIEDGAGGALQTGMREIARLLQRVDGARIRLTPNQNLVLANIDPSQRAAIDAITAAHGLDAHLRATPVRLAALACVALPTCGLAMAEAERYLPAFLDRFEALLDRHGLREAPIHLRLSGCPNGCSRPYLGEIALVGRAPGRYALRLGADHRGQRLNTAWRDNVDEDGIIDALDPLLARYAAERGQHERFGDFLVAAGIVDMPRRIPLALQEAVA